MHRKPLKCRVYTFHVTYTACVKFTISETMMSQTRYTMIALHGMDVIIYYIYNHLYHHLLHTIICSHVYNHLDTTNKFVDISYDAASKTIICVFQNDHAHGQKSCSVRYGIQSTEGTYCNINVSLPPWTNSTNNSNHVYVTKMDAIGHEIPRGSNCFTATATNGKHTLIINGSFVIVEGKNHFQCGFSTTLESILHSVCAFMPGIVESIVDCVSILPHISFFSPRHNS